MKKAIVLGADNGYMDKVETTIKSVCAHNDNIKFYIFNDDLPSDWFRIMNFRLKANHSEIVNVKISDHTLKNYRLAISYLSYAAFFRYFIGEFVEEDRAIYLDSDIIVTSCLDELFNIDLEDYWLAGVADYFDGDYTGGFNSGMMVIPVKKWKESDIANQLLQLTEQYHQTVFGDQGILNILFKEKWKKVGRLYNFMVGMDTLAQVVNDESWYQSSLPDGVLPKVIHYTGDKPWYHLSKNRYRSIWWFYYSVEWSDIILRKEIIKHGLEVVTEKEKYHTAIFTNACEMEHLEYLIKALPEVHFHILAHTNFASQVVDLQRYLNVSIYPQFNRYNFENILNRIDFYLDINHYNEIMNIIQEIHRLGKPIFSFDNTSKDQTGKSFIFSSLAPETMVEAIITYLNSLHK
ncbi:TPA: glycosyltransferase family 8 protein [Streptococcus pneumoniae]